MPGYRYYKRSDDRDSTARMILRESLSNGFELECWRIDRWESAIDYWWQTRQECDYWDISEDEALGELEALGRRQMAASERQEREEAAAREDRQRADAAAMERILRRRKLAREEEARGDSWTSLELSAVVLHELFKTLVKVGFTEDQALTVISKIVIGGLDSADQSDIGDDR